MSHYAVSKIKITNPDKELLLKTLQEIAKKLGGKVVENAVVRGWNFRKQVDYLVQLDLPYGNGYGIIITSNGVEVHVDDHGAPMTARQFADELVTLYTKNALEQTLREMGYSVQVEKKDKQIVLVGVEAGWGW